MIYTVGHSNHPIEQFIGLLQPHGITAIADVRSTPYSRFNPQFRREKLQAALASAGIQYVFLGQELGARSEDPAVYDATGRVSYALLAKTEPFPPRHCSPENRHGRAPHFHHVRRARTFRLSPHHPRLPRASPRKCPRHPHSGRRHPRAPRARNATLGGKAQTSKR